MNDELVALWKQYNEVRISGNKKVANTILLNFIQLLQQQETPVIEQFVDEICSLVLDKHEQVIATNGEEMSESSSRIQHPLFREILLPVLQDQYQNASAKHIRWIGQLEQFFYADMAATNAFLSTLGIAGYFETRHFFERSYAIHKDPHTLHLLLNRMARDIDHYLHELPGAILVDPLVLVEELRVFREYCEFAVIKEKWDLAHWELIAKHWLAYSSQQEKNEDLETYLGKNGVQFN